jgi:hypothetical protein
MVVFDTEEMIKVSIQTLAQWIEFIVVIIILILL